MIKEHVKEYYSKYHNISKEESELHFERLIQFLDDSSKSRLNLKVPKEVDPVWHMFILHTKDYIEFCNRRYGKVIHHIPKINKYHQSECDANGDHE